MEFNSIVIVIIVNFTCREGQRSATLVEAAVVHPRQIAAHSTGHADEVTAADGTASRERAQTVRESADQDRDYDSGGTATGAHDGL